MLNKLLRLLHIIGMALYLGGIVTHIIFPIVAGSNLSDIYFARQSMELIADIMINPGFVVAFVTGMIMFVRMKRKAGWVKWKLGISICLGINAFFFLMPITRELTQLSAHMLSMTGPSEEFQTAIHREEMIGAANGLPLLVVIILGVFRPKKGLISVVMPW